MIIGELKEDAKKFGDERRSPIVARAEAVQIKEQDLMPAETVTVVLSEAGWVRAAKGADVDAENLNYRAGDQYLSHAVGKPISEFTSLMKQGAAMPCQLVTYLQREAWGSIKF